MLAKLARTRHLPEVVRIGSGRDLAQPQLRTRRHLARAGEHQDTPLYGSYDLRTAGAKRTVLRITTTARLRRGRFRSCGSSPGGIASEGGLAVQGHRKGRARPLLLRRAGPWSAPLEPHVQQPAPQQQHGSEPGRRGLSRRRKTDRRHLRCSAGAAGRLLQDPPVDHLRRTRRVFDHVPPESTIAPDGEVWHEGEQQFGFDRLGVRVPTVLVSPWLAAGMDDRVFDDSSIVASLRKMFGLAAEPLTRCDAQANGFHDMMVRDQVRALPDLRPADTQSDLERMALKAMPGDAEHQAMDEFQASLVVLARGVDRKLDEEAAGAPRDEPALMAPAESAPVDRPLTRELTAYLDYVTRRLQATVDDTALDLVDSRDVRSRVPDAARIESAFSNADRGPGSTWPRLATERARIGGPHRSGRSRQTHRLAGAGAEEVLTGAAPLESTGPGVVSRASAATLALRALRSARPCALTAGPLKSACERMRGLNRAMFLRIGGVLERLQDAGAAGGIPSLRERGLRFLELPRRPDGAAVLRLDPHGAPRASPTPRSSRRTPDYLRRDLTGWTSART